jgi:hypothetical protein
MASTGGRGLQLCSHPQGAGLVTWLTLFSNDSMMVLPGWHSSLLCCAFSTSFFT